MSLSQFPPLSTIAALATAPALLIQSALGHLTLRHHVGLVRDAPKGAFPPEWHDLAFLYRTVRERRPRVVLEFGSGCSTPIIAAALEENGVGHIVSLESSKEWLAVTRQYFPRRLASRCELLYSPAVTATHEGTAVWRYQDVPSVVPDLIYLDGPPLQDLVGSVDVLDLEDRLAPGATLIVDGRKRNFAYLRQHLKRQWRFEWHRIAYRGVARLVD